MEFRATTISLSLSLIYCAVSPAFAFTCQPDHQSQLRAQTDLHSDATVFALVSFEKIESSVEESSLCLTVNFKLEHVFSGKTLRMNHIRFCYENFNVGTIESENLHTELKEAETNLKYWFGWESSQLSTIAVTEQEPIKDTFSDIRFSSKYRFIFSPCFTFFSHPVSAELQNLPREKMIVKFQSEIDSIAEYKTNAD